MLTLVVSGAEKGKIRGFVINHQHFRLVAVIIPDADRNSLERRADKFLGVITDNENKDLLACPSVWCPHTKLMFILYRHSLTASRSRPR